MRRRQLAVALVAVASAAAGIGLAWQWRSSPSPPMADAFFARAYTHVDGAEHSMQRWHGRPLVVNFWATWCAPCVEEMPELQRIHDDYVARGVAVVGLGIDAPAAIRTFRDELRLTLPLYLAGADGSELARHLGNPSGSLPYTILIDREGRIVQARLGQIRGHQLRAWLDALLGSQAS